MSCVPKVLSSVSTRPSPRRRRRPPSPSRANQWCRTKRRPSPPNVGRHQQRKSVSFAPRSASPEVNSSFFQPRHSRSLRDCPTTSIPTLFGLSLGLCALPPDTSSSPLGEGVPRNCCGLTEGERGCTGPHYHSHSHYRRTKSAY